MLQQREDVFAAGIEHGPGLGDSDIALVLKVLDDALSHLAVGTGIEDHSVSDPDDLALVDEDAEQFGVDLIFAWRRIGVFL